MFLPVLIQSRKKGCMQIARFVQSEKGCWCAFTWMVFEVVFARLDSKKQKERVQAMQLARLVQSEKGVFVVCVHLHGWMDGNGL